jgi:hypothetical protein
MALLRYLRDLSYIEPIAKAQAMPDDRQMQTQ